MTAKLAQAARKLIERLDVIEAATMSQLEQAIYRDIRATALEYGVGMQELWDEAKTVEPDPIERHRSAIGRNWRPNLAGV